MDLQLHFSLFSFLEEVQNTYQKSEDCQSDDKTRLCLRKKLTQNCNKKQPICMISYFTKIFHDVNFMCNIMYVHNECTETFQFKLCSKCDREHDFDIALG